LIAFISMVFAKSSLLVASAVAASNDEWEAWKQEHGRVYNGADEDAYRRSVFEANLAEAAELQKQNPLAEFGATKFSDWTREEFKERVTNYVPSNETFPEMDLSHLPVEVAASQDWTGKYTTPVKDQGQCGSCWAFSAVEQVESDLMREHGTKISLSTQQLVDCTGSGGRRNGCNGGDPTEAYQVIEQLGGIESESSYRYTARNGNCQFSRSKVAAKVSSYKSVGRGSESSMQSYVGSTGPLSVCVDANSWNSYRGGIMTSCGNNVDHCVQIVGYGTSGSTNYWKVRNSWGGNWGESGHMRLKIGSNLCRINGEPTAVTVSASEDGIMV
jgi:C1A family cysteine protease